MNEPTLPLAMRPPIGAKVEIVQQRIAGEIVGVRAAMRPGVWFLDIRPELGIEEEIIRNVYSTGVFYIEAGGIKRPVSPVGEEPRLGGAA